MDNNRWSQDLGRGWMQLGDKGKVGQESASRPVVAFCYDFDKTLSPDDMQTFTLLPALNISTEDFWCQCSELTYGHSVDSNLSWMYLLLEKARQKELPLNRELFRQAGSQVPLYQGVAEWFSLINECADRLGLEARHYVISSGLKEIIEGSSIAKFLTRIYASSYYYDAEEGQAIWPAQSVNYTNKTQFLFRISKGYLEEGDDRVNDIMPRQQLVIPFTNFVYIGDSETDIPCMSLIKSKGGFAVGVYDRENKGAARIKRLYDDGRVNYFTTADYRAGSPLYRYVKAVLTYVASKSHLNSLQNNCFYTVE